MFIRLGSYALAVAVAAATSDAAAQAHTDIYVFSNGGVLTTGAFGCPDSSCGSGDVLPGTRVFSEVLNGFGVERNPGFRSQGGDLPGLLDIDWDFLPLTVDSGPHAGHTSALLYWDGVGSEAQFGPPPTADYGLAYQGKDNEFSFAGSGDEIVAGKTAFTSTLGGATHTHGNFVLDANSDLTTLDDITAGVYVASMQLRAEGLESSDPVFLVFRTVEPALAPALPIATAWVSARVDTLFVEGLPGDFNGDGFVNAADYTTWQDGLAGGDFTPDQYDVWADNYGLTNVAAATAVPEPSGAVLLAIALVGATRRRR